jgi:hypothetical protein
VLQVVESLSTKLRAWASNPNTTKKKMKGEIKTFCDKHKLSKS